MARRLSGLVAAIVAVLAITVSNAQAYTSHHYFHGLVQPYSWTGLYYGAPQGTETGNVASYPGSGNVTVCEAVWSIYLQQYVQSSCGTNAAGNVTNVQAYYGWDLWNAVENGSSSAHTIDGVDFTSP
ncbi:MAG TPA: hypothetical protein VFF79_06405 [Conexibacter sp.]|jgi:hypothetical protein|nr:hypothetical protein [Conexibacter sp.]